MINWILGALIFGATLFIIYRYISKIKKGESPCGCECENKTNCCGKS